MPTVLENASSRLRSSMRGTVALVVVDGQGALVTPAQTWRTAARWAQARQSVGLVAKDVSMIVQRIDIAVVRPGTTFAQTIGASKPLYELRREMLQAGFDIKEWEFPRNLDAVMEAVSGPMPGKKTGDDGGTQDEGGAGTEPDEDRPQQPE